ncbi:MAG: helix-turn-helix transcriptional regulator [Coriobacteriaceae bacterium]|nr:helix-turn-helix transcriptional regulator [Coriobacteriaceae bacterium]
MRAKGVLSWKRAAQTELFDGWQRWLSFACIWVWSCITSKLAFDNEVLTQLAGVLAAPNEVTLIAAALSLVAVFLFAKRIPSIVESPKLMTLTGCLLTGGSLLFIMATLASSPLLFIGGMICGGASIALLKIAYGEMYSRMGLRQGLLSIGYAVVSSTIIVLLAHGLPPLWLAASLLLVALPCVPLAFRGARGLAACGHGQHFDEGQGGSVRFSASLLLLPFLVSLSFGIVKGMLPWLEVVEKPFIDSVFRYAELLVGCALVVSSYFLGKRFGAAQIYAFALIFVVAGLILFSYQPAPQPVSFFVHEVGFALFYFFMIVYWGDLARRTGMPIVKVYAIGYGTFQFSQIGGSLLGFYVVGDPSLNYALLVLFSVVLAFFVIVLLLLGTGRSTLRQWLVADEYSAPELGDEIPIAVAALCAQHRLSPREHEVLGLVARGRNASWCARALHVSPDTAKTHIKNIYRKLGVHTQQELIDMIDKTVAKRGNGQQAG